MAFDDDDPKPMTNEEIEAWREGLFDRHPHLTRPNMRPLLQAVTSSYYNDLVRTHGGHAPAQHQMRVHADRIYNEVENQVMETGRTVKRAEKAKHGTPLVEVIQRDQFDRGTHDAPDWMDRREVAGIKEERRARSRLGMMRVAG